MRRIETSEEIYDWYFDHHQITGRITTLNISGSVRLILNGEEYQFEYETIKTWDRADPYYQDNTIQVFGMGASSQLILSRAVYYDKNAIPVAALNYDDWGCLCGVEYGVGLTDELLPEESETRNINDDSVTISRMNLSVWGDSGQAECLGTKTYDSDGRLVSYTYSGLGADPSAQDTGVKSLSCVYEYDKSGKLASEHREVDGQGADYYLRRGTRDVWYESTGKVASIDFGESHMPYLYTYDSNGVLTDIYYDLTNQWEEYYPEDSQEQFIQRVKTNPLLPINHWHDEGDGMISFISVSPERYIYGSIFENAQMMDSPKETIQRNICEGELAQSASVMIRVYDDFGVDVERSDYFERIYDESGNILTEETPEMEKTYSLVDNPDGMSRDYLRDDVLILHAIRETVPRSEAEFILQ